LLLERDLNDIYWVSKEETKRHKKELSRKRLVSDLIRLMEEEF
jgi:hypothetical protein